MPVTELHQHNSDLLQENRLLRERLAGVQQQLEWFKRQLFGRTSEKRLLIEASQQHDLLAALGVKAAVPVPPPTETVTYERRKKARGNCVNDTGLRFDESVPVEVIELNCPELSGSEAEHYEVIGQKSTHRLAQRPGSYVVLEYRRAVIKRRDTQAILTPAAPANVLEKSVADVSFLAGMLIDKFVYHQPLYRQHQRLEQNGIQLARATLTQLSSRAIELLRPIHDAQLEHILQSRVLAMDETPIKAGRKAQGQMRQAYFWPLYGEADEVAFTYGASRQGAHVAKLLEGRFSGVLVSDGYEAYARYARSRLDITHAECWAHTRRYYERAQEAEPQASAEALAFIGALYAQEQSIREKGLTGEAKLKVRAEHSAPIVHAFWQWCDAQCQRHDLEPSNPLTKALKYALGRVVPLQVFLSDPDVPIDTNHLERSLRPIPLGRRNWMFCWTEIGAELVGIIQSLLVTCRLHSVNPYTYLVDVLQRVGEHPASAVLDLTPRVWKAKFADNPLRSDLERVNNNGLV